MYKLKVVLIFEIKFKHKNNVLDIIDQLIIECFKIIKHSRNFNAILLLFRKIFNKLFMEIKLIPC